MFKHILVPTDGSDSARHALEVANRMALSEKADLTLLAVVQYEPAISESYFFPFFIMPVVFPIQGEQAHADLTGAYMKGLEKLRAEAVDPSLTVNLKVLIGRPHETIIAYAKDNSIDLIVVGACGLGSIEDRLLGSVSDRVAHHAPCHVLIAK